jgi:hypothetical protein
MSGVPLSYPLILPHLATDTTYFCLHVMGNRLEAREPSLERLKNPNSYDKSYDKSILDRFKRPSSDRSSWSLSATGRPHRVSGLSPQSAASDTYSFYHPSLRRPSERMDSNFSPLSDSKRSPSVEESDMPRYNHTPDSAISALSGLSTRFLNPRVAPRQSSSLSSVAEDGLSPSESDGGFAQSRNSLSFPSDAMGPALHASRPVFGPQLFEEPEPEPESVEGMSRLRLEPDKSPPRHSRCSPSSRASRKRQASSPIREREERSALPNGAGAGGERFQRRPSAYLSSQRTSPVSAFPLTSLSTNSGVPRSSSIVSTATTPTLLTSVSSPQDRLSPAVLSPASEREAVSPYICSPSSATDSLPKVHPRPLADAGSSPVARRLSQEDAAPLKQHSMPRMHGGFICDCCPKKPKRFETAEDLRYTPTQPYHDFLHSQAFH